MVGGASEVVAEESDVKEKLVFREGTVSIGLVTVEVFTETGAKDDWPAGVAVTKNGAAARVGTGAGATE